MNMFKSINAGTKLGQGLLACGGAAGMTAGFFLILPMIQAIGDQAKADLVLQEVETVDLPPPPPPVEEETPPEEPDEPPPPGTE